MKAFVVFSAIFAVAFAQQGRYVDPKNAAILAEARYLSGDGSFGSAYVQEDGVEFKEETSDNGERKGQYSYVDPNGKKITVQYTAGKNGFQVSGDHLPKAPAPLPVPQAAPQQRQYQQPAPQYNQQPQYNAIPQQQQSYSNGNDDGSYSADKYETPYQYNYGTYNNQPAPQQQQPAPVQSQFQFNNNQQQQGFQQQQQYQTTTQAPNRFFPPGKISLNRSPDGYQYNFSSN